ncbi:hypothetical protein BH09SUM1_BH09SUM1_01290 [soil metagenome]
MNENQEPIAFSEPLPTQRRDDGRKTFHLIACLTVLILMSGFAFANAKYFVLVCQRIGILSKESNSVIGTIDEKAGGRPLEVYFSASVNGDLPIMFTVSERYQKSATGLRKKNDYRFVNTSNRTIYFKPVHDVYPPEAGTPEIMTLEKCFCFTQQKIDPGETKVMSVVYSFNNKLDPKCGVIKMTYTLHESDPETYAASLKAAQGNLAPEAAQ